MPEPGISIFTPSATPPTNPSPAVPVERSTPRVASHTSVADVRSNPTEAPWQARWDADQRALDRENPWRDTKNTIISKSPDGTLQVRQRTGNGQQDAAPGTGEQPQPQPQPGSATVEGDRLKFADFDLSSDDVRGLMERASLEQSRAANAPKDAGDYGLDLPEDFVLPPGAEWKWNVEDPVSAALLSQAQQFAFAHGLDKPAFSKLLGLYASNQIAEAQRIAELQKAEREKLGANISARVDSVNRWLESQVGSDLAKTLRQSMHTAKSVEAYEKMMAKYVSGGVTGNPTAGRDPGANKPGQLTDEQYGKLTYTQKLQYAQQFDQRQFQNGG